MDKVSLEDFLLKYDFRITNDRDIQLTRIVRICLDTVGENDWIMVKDSGQITRIPIHTPANNHRSVYFNEISLFLRSRSIKTKYI